MASERTSLGVKQLRITGSARVGRNSSGFGLIDSLLALFISATLIAPVLGAVLVVLKTAPGGATGSAISGQQATNRQNFELNLTSARMRNEWSDATIVKTPAAFNEYQGLDCGGGGLGSLSGNPTTELKFSLQVRSLADTDLSLLRGEKLGLQEFTGTNQGLTRIVYSLLPDGNGLKSLVRRECAVEKGILMPDGSLQYEGPRVKSASNDEGRNDFGKITSDYRGWRLQPGVIKPSGAGSGYASTANWAPQEPKTVLTSVSDVQLVSPRCNELSVNPDANLVDVPDDLPPINKTKEELLVLYPYYTRCDVKFTVIFGDGRTHTVRLYQGSGA